MQYTKFLISEYVKILKTHPVLAIIKILSIIYLFYHPIVFICESLFLFCHLTFLTYCLYKISGWMNKIIGETESYIIKNQAIICRCYTLIIEAYIIFKRFTGNSEGPYSLFDVLISLRNIFISPIVTEIIIVRFLNPQVKKLVTKRNRIVEILIATAYVILLSLDFGCPQWIVISLSTIIAYEAMKIQRILFGKVVFKDTKEIEMRG
uniref:Protein RFT1 homolog n=1 Tax=Caenorhabditis tropicalis TaxID=1561998 RepID=A0A1I7THF9_9PELO